jgi:hypothetical protein
MMSKVLLKDILDSEFRANPAYRLVLFDRLPPEQREPLRDLTKDPDFYGVLVPADGSTRKIKSVCRETALLLYTLQQPGHLPEYVRATHGDECNQAVAELVLDEVLEMNRDARFVSGSEAFDLIYGARESPGAQGTLPRLAQAALEYAQSLDIDDSGKLSARLYFYNRVPLTPSWKRRFPGSDAVAAYLGIDSGGANRRILESGWYRTKAPSQFDGWFHWQSRTERTPEAEVRQTYKLYVSPRPESVSDAFRSVAEILADSPAFHFKVGWDVAGLLRPDKIVIYFSKFEALRNIADLIARRLDGCAAQGVPFTAAIGESPLLSWGADPLPVKGVLSWQERESWRLWITNRLATSLLVARSAQNGGLEPWQFALERLRLDNVDIDTWTPLAAFGQPASVGS